MPLRLVGWGMPSGSAGSTGPATPLDRWPASATSANRNLPSGVNASRVRPIGSLEMWPYGCSQPVVLLDTSTRLKDPAAPSVVETYRPLPGAAFAVEPSECVMVTL